MNEHYEAFLMGYLEDLIDEGECQLADDFLAQMREALQAHEEEADRLKHAHMAERIVERAQHLHDAATWRRILADPTLPTTLVRIEDAILDS